MVAHRLALPQSAAPLVEAARAGLIKLFPADVCQSFDIAKSRAWGCSVPATALTGAACAGCGTARKILAPTSPRERSRKVKVRWGEGIPHCCPAGTTDGLMQRTEIGWPPIVLGAVFAPGSKPNAAKTIEVETRGAPPAS